MLRFRTGVVLLAVLLAALPGAVLAQSQATTGVIEGTASDDAGAPLPGASVAIRNTATNFEKTTTTGPDGRFRGLALPLGPYRVTVSLAGFTHARARGPRPRRRPDDQPPASRSGSPSGRSP